MQSLLLSYYGDDLTGSTDVMEALASNGVSTALFLRRPSDDELSRFSDCQAIGIAGTSRSEAPAWMDDHLPGIFAWLRGLGARFCHYKVCSTFDSSPEIGSIGRAIDIGAVAFDQERVALVVGTPQLKRYTAFGHLFAGYRGETFRIDRHPVMSRHPVTPMMEADLRLHLQRQTARRVGLVDLAALASEAPDAKVDEVLSGDQEIILFDVADLATQGAVGRQLTRIAPTTGPFVVGSSGVEYALVSEWRRQGVVDCMRAFDPVKPADRIAVVSGSCSPTTERQIKHARDDGFAAVAIAPQRLAGPDAAAAIGEAVAAGDAVLAEGRSVVLYTALGPASDVDAAIDGSPGGRHAVGEGLGQVLKQLVARNSLVRAVIAGGDTSSHALRQLDVFALTTRMPMPQTPGSPLCRAYSNAATFDGLEIALKGGQVGADDYFCRIRDGNLQG
jgi:3-oxoisoapionate kinase